MTLKDADEQKREALGVKVQEAWPRTGGELPPSKTLEEIESMGLSENEKKVLRQLVGRGFLSKVAESIETELKIREKTSGALFRGEPRKRLNKDSSINLLGMLDMMPITNDPDENTGVHFFLDSVSDKDWAKGS